MTIFKRGVRNAYSYHFGMHRMQTAELPDEQKQEEQSGSFGTEKILTVLQKRNITQRNEIID